MVFACTWLDDSSQQSSTTFTKLLVTFPCLIFLLINQPHCVLLLGVHCCCVCALSEVISVKLYVGMICRSMEYVAEVVFKFQPFWCPLPSISYFVWRVATLTEKMIGRRSGSKIITCRKVWSGKTSKNLTTGKCAHNFSCPIFWHAVSAYIR